MLKKLPKISYLILLSLTASLSVSAETANNQILETSLTPTDSFLIFKNISGSVGVSYESNFYEYEAANKEQSLNLQLEFVLKKDDWKYGVSALVSKELSNEEQTEFGDTKLFVTKPLDLFAPESSFSSSMSTTLALPTSEVSRYEKKMYGNFSAGPSLKWNSGKFDILLAPRLGKVFNKYKTTYSGEANTSYYTKMSVAPAYQISNSVTTQFTTSVTQAWTDNNSRKSPTYVSELNTELRLDAKSAVGFAISNEDKIYKSNGTSSNVKFFDKNSSLYSLTLTRDF